MEKIDVLKLKLEDIQREPVVEPAPLPTKYESWTSYRAALKPLAKEELRAQLHQQLEEHLDGKNSFALVSLWEDLKGQSRRSWHERLEDEPFVFNVQIERGSDRQTVADLLPLSCVLLCEPGAIPARTPRAYLFGIVVAPQGSRIVLAPSGNEEAVRLLKESRKWELYHMGSVATDIRIGAVLAGEWQPSQHIISAILGLDLNQAMISSSPTVVAGSTLNTSQSSAVDSAWRTKGITLIHGPPGTGKTTTSCELLLLPYNDGMRTLACAPSNGAVGVLLRKFLTKAGEGANRQIVLVAQEQRASVKDDASDPSSVVLLTHRVRRIRKAFGLWLGHLDTLRKSLENPVKLFDSQETMVVEWTADWSTVVRNKMLSRGWAPEKVVVTDRRNVRIDLSGPVRPSEDSFPLTLKGKAAAPRDAFVEMLQRGWTLYMTDAERDAKLVAQSVTDGMAATSLGQACSALVLALTKLQIVLRDLLGKLAEPDVRASIEQDLKRFRIQTRAASQGFDNEPGEDMVLASLGEHIGLCNAALQQLLHAVSSGRSYAEYNGDDDEDGGSGNSTHNEISLTLLQGATMVFCTTSVSANKLLRDLVEDHPFEVVLTDEACQAVEPDNLLPLGPRVQKLWLVGDPRQLPATVISQHAKDSKYDRPLFERLQGLGLKAQLLAVQHRMHPEISCFVNNQFYQGRLSNAESVVASAKQGPNPPPRFNHIVWFDTALLGYTEERPKEGTSWQNKPEAAKVVAHLREFARSDFYKKLSSVTSEPLTVGIISPYSAQVSVLEELVRSSKELPKQLKSHVDVRSVDGFQGQERDIIIFSAVRANRKSVIGFLRDVRRLNVALSRAKHFLWIFGHVPTLAHCSVSSGGEGATAWRSLHSHIQDLGRVLPADGQISEAHAAQLTRMNDRMSSSSSTPAGQHRAPGKHANSTVAKPVVFDKGTKLLSGADQVAWEVVVSKAVKENLDSRKDQARQYVMEALLSLSQGKHKDFPRAKGQGVVQQNFYQIKIKNGVLAFSIVIDEGSFQQTLKIWNLLDLRYPREVESLRQRVMTYMKTFSDEYLENCSQRDEGGGIVRPITFAAFNFRRRQASTQDPLFEQVDGEIQPLSLEKFYGFGFDQMQQMLKGELRTASLPLKLNAEEQCAVDWGLILFLLGRAGAGKTAVVLERALQSQRAWQVLRNLNSEGESPRTASSLVLTMSSRLCLHLAKEYSKVWSAEAPKGEAGTCSPNGEDPALMDDAAQQRALEALPSHFADADDIIKKTPTLIVTTAKFISMLDVTLPSPFLTKDREHHEITYERFVEDYWPSMKRAVNEKSETQVLVFKEIISVIKGSSHVVKEGTGKPMPRSYYEKGSQMRDSCFLHDSTARTRVYNAFEIYEQLRRRNPMDYDIVDVVSDLMKRILRHGYKGTCFESLLIDEAQDVLPCVFLLLQYVCPNIHRWTLAADTAQTIGRLAHWRFATVRACIHDHIMQEEDRRKAPMPDVIALTQNYRSVRGVLELAASIIDALVNYFPDHVDELPRERALVDSGARPIFTSAVPLEKAMLLFSQESSAGGKERVLEFGAQQALIVRRDKDKQRLKTQFPTSLVLTPYDAKGQEFDDVIVINFVNSTIEDGGKGVWRFLPQFIADMKKMGRDPWQSLQFWGGYTLRPGAAFDPAQHAILNEYLKELYVVITRAKKRLIFFDEPGPESTDVQAYWRSLQLVNACDTESELEDAFKNFGRLVQESTAAEWLQQGTALFQSDKFEEASLCFKRAQEKALSMFADAAALCRSANAMRDATKRKDVMLEASVLYRDLAKGLYSCSAQEAKSLLPPQRELALRWGRCLLSGLKYVEAAGVFDSYKAHKEAGEAWEKAQDFGKAALSYRNGMMWGRSAECFERAKQWSEAAQCWMKATSFDKAGDCFEKAKDWQQAAAAYEQAKNFKKAGSCWEEAKNFKKALQAYQQGQHWDGAARMHEKQNEWKEAAAEWRKCKKFKNAGAAWEQAGNTPNALAAYLDGWENKTYKLGLSLASKCLQTRTVAKPGGGGAELAAHEMAEFALSILSQFVAEKPGFEQRLSSELPGDTQEILSQCAGILFEIDKNLIHMNQLGLSPLTHDTYVQKGVFRLPALIELGRQIYPGLFSDTLSRCTRMLTPWQQKICEIASQFKELFDDASKQCKSAAVKSANTSGLLRGYGWLIDVLVCLGTLGPQKLSDLDDLAKKLQQVVDFVNKADSGSAPQAVQTVVGMLLLDLCAGLESVVHDGHYAVLDASITKTSTVVLDNAHFIRKDILDVHCSQSNRFFRLHQEAIGCIALWEIASPTTRPPPKSLVVRSKGDAFFSLQSLAHRVQNATGKERVEIEFVPFHYQESQEVTSLRGKLQLLSAEELKKKARDMGITVDELNKIGDPSQTKKAAERAMMDFIVAKQQEKEQLFSWGLGFTARRAGHRVWRTCQQAVNYAIDDMWGLSKSIWNWLPPRTEALLQELLLTWTSAGDDLEAKHIILQKRLFNTSFDPGTEYHPDQFAKEVSELLCAQIRNAMKDIAWWLGVNVEGALAAETKHKPSRDSDYQTACYSRWFARCSMAIKPVIEDAENWLEVQRSFEKISNCRVQAANYLQKVIYKHAESSAGHRGPPRDKFERMRREKVIAALRAVRKVDLSSLSAYRLIATSKDAQRLLESAAGHSEAVASSLAEAEKVCDAALVD